MRRVDDMLIARVMVELNIWGENIGDDMDAQWESMNCDPDAIGQLGDVIMQASELYDNDPERFVPNAIAYALAIGIRLGREQTWSES